MLCNESTAAGGTPITADCHEIIDQEHVFVGGFSYGAATAALASVQRPGAYQATVLIDGWFNIDLRKTTGVAFDFPQEAHASGISIPCLFVGSEKFAHVEVLAKVQSQWSLWSLTPHCPGTGDQESAEQVPSSRGARSGGHPARQLLGCDLVATGLVPKA